eukprot:9536880-Lingulodinium_polyedra.AAC.1
MGSIFLAIYALELHRGALHRDVTAPAGAQNRAILCSRAGGNHAVFTRAANHRRSGDLLNPGL